MVMPFYVCAFALIVALSSESVSSRPTEEERVKVWKEENTWPPNWQPESSSQHTFYATREKEIMKLKASDERWENWMQFVQSRLVQNFTEKGFQLVETPAYIQDKLAAALVEGLEEFDGLTPEATLPLIYTPPGSSPKMIYTPWTNWALMELKGMHEEWSGLDLEPTSAYGIRLYLNGSSLAMHCDRIETHVISSIIHVGHEYDSDKEPWPIQIEDHDGNLHALNLEPGQMLFYESSKCLHGRMKVLKGKYYAGIFIHYKPVDRSIWSYNTEDVIASVPPHWKDGISFDYGSRYSGAAMTIDSRVCDGAPPRQRVYRSRLSSFASDL